MNSNQHGIPLHELVMFALGEAGPSSTAEINAALRDTPAVAEDLRLVESMLAVLRQGVFEPVPAALKAAARDAWSRTPSLAEWLEGVLESTLAVVFDSRQTPEIAGFRGEIAGRHMTFAGDDVEVDVLIEHDGDSCTLHGQVTGTTGDRVAAIAESGDVLESATIDTDGAFTLTLHPRARDLSIRSGCGAIRLSGVQ